MSLECIFNRQRDQQTNIQHWLYLELPSPETRSTSRSSPSPSLLHTSARSCQQEKYASENATRNAANNYKCLHMQTSLVRPVGCFLMVLWPLKQTKTFRFVLILFYRPLMDQAHLQRRQHGLVLRLPHRCHFLLFRHRCATLLISGIPRQILAFLPPSNRRHEGIPWGKSTQDLVTL